MRNFYLGSLQIHDSVAPGDIWIKIPIVGLDTPEMRINTYDKPGENGSVVSSMFYGARNVTLEGFVKGSTPAIYETNRKALIAACAQTKDSYGYPTPTTVTFTTLGGTTYYFKAYIKRPVMDYADINFARFMIELIVPNPSIFSNTASTTSIARAIGGGAVVPFIVPVILAPGSGGTGTSVNNGNATTYPVLTLTGPLTSPYIANTTNGKAMQLNYTINTGNTVIIDMFEKTIMLNATSSILSTKTLDSEWWALDPGTNNISFSTSNTADTGTLLITYNDAYLGV